jgi:hypothetical protein
MIHTRYGGSGLGLFICKSKSSRGYTLGLIGLSQLTGSCHQQEITEMLGGRIEVQSELGKGSGEPEHGARQEAPRHLQVMSFFRRERQRSGFSSNAALSTRSHSDHRLPMTKQSLVNLHPVELHAGRASPTHHHLQERSKNPLPRTHQHHSPRRCPKHPDCHQETPCTS